MKLNFKKVGEGSKVVLILHGLFGSLDNWMTHAKLLSEQDFTVYLIDQRNHGRSPHDSIFDYESMAADLNEFINDHAISNPYLVGHSMGGKTVMQFAVSYTTTIKKLIVVDIAPKTYPPHHETIIEAFRSVDINGITKRSEAQEAMSEIISDVGVMQFLLKNLDRKKEGGFQWKVNLDVVIDNIENVGQTFDSSLSNTVETLFIRGGKSNYILDEDRSLLKKFFPNSNLLTIKDAGHWVHAEQFEKFTKVLIHYLNA